MTGQFSEDLFYFPTERKKMQTSRRQLNDKCIITQWIFKQKGEEAHDKSKIIKTR